MNVPPFSPKSGVPPAFTTGRGIFLYSRPGCSCCQTAAEVLRQAGLPFEVRDVSTRPEWEDAYGQQIPVVEIGGRVRFRGRIDPKLLRRIIRAEGLQTRP